MSHPSAILRLSALLAAALLATSCAGYRLGPAKPAALAHVNVIAVPNAKNETLQPRIDTLVTNAIISRLSEDGTFRVALEGDADAVLEAKIVRIERRQLRSARFNQLRSRELGLRVIVEYRLVDLETGLILRAGSERGETSVFIDANYQNAERQAIPEAANRVASRIVTNISEGW